MTDYIVVRDDGPDSFVAYPCGLPELTVRASTRADAVAGAARQLNEWLQAGRLVPVRLSGFPTANGPAPDPDEPMQRAFEEALEQSRRNDLERTLAEYEAECSGSSSTPTT